MSHQSNWAQATANPPRREVKCPYCGEESRTKGKNMIEYQGQGCWFCQVCCKSWREKP